MVFSVLFSVCDYYNPRANPTKPFFLAMGVRRGGQEGALSPLGGQNSIYFDLLFFRGKYYLFCCFFFCMIFPFNSKLAVSK